MSIKFLLLVLAVASAPAAAADVYKWTDAGGVVHYSDTEPASELKAQRLHLTETSTNEVAAGTTESGEPMSAARPDKTPDGTLVSAVQSAERRCADARNNLELLQSRYAVGLDPQGTGKPEVLDDQARQAQIARAQTLIAANCK